MTVWSNVFHDHRVISSTDKKCVICKSTKDGGKFIWIQTKSKPFLREDYVCKNCYAEAALTENTFGVVTADQIFNSLVDIATDMRGATKEIMMEMSRQMDIFDREESR
jgi:hypothetical protein